MYKKKIVKNYNLIKILGSGSFGTVYLANKNNILNSGEDNKDINENKYAVKEFLDFSHNRTNFKLIKKEIVIMSSINSIYAVKIFDHFEYNKNYYIVMEYCENGDLSNLINKYKKEKKKIENNLIWKIIHSVFNAINELYNFNIIHRDIKPSNILLTKNNEIKLADYGVSRFLNKYELAATMIGTPYYMCPEILDNKKYNYKCDMWSLGCVIFELITLERVYTGGNICILVNNIYKNKPKLNLIKDIRLKYIISKLLEKDPIRRMSLIELKLHLPNCTISDSDENLDNEKI